MLYQKVIIHCILHEEFYFEDTFRKPLKGPWLIIMCNTTACESLKFTFLWLTGSELRNWLLFYSLPVLKDVLPNPYLSHYSMLVAALSLLSSDRITLSDHDVAAEYLQQFYQKFHELYGKLIITSIQLLCNGPIFYSTVFKFHAPHNIIHSLIWALGLISTCTLWLSFNVLCLLIYVGERHVPMNVHLLCDYVKIWGPLWCYSCFTFETMDIWKLFHGTKDMTKQVMLSTEITYNIIIIGT